MPLYYDWSAPNITQPPATFSLCYSFLRHRDVILQQFKNLAFGIDLATELKTVMTHSTHVEYYLRYRNVEIINPHVTF